MTIPKHRCNCCGLPVSKKDDKRDMAFLICDMCAKLTDDQLDKLPDTTQQKH